MTIFWAAGQERVARDQRSRMTEIFAGVRDGYTAAQVAGEAWKLKDGGTLDLPAYVTEGRPDPNVKTGEDLYRDWGHVAQERPN